MNCDQIEELLSDLLDDELPEGARRGVETHIASCERCTRAYHQLKRTVRFVRSNADVSLHTGGGRAYMEFSRLLIDPNIRAGDPLEPLREELRKEN